MLKTFARAAALFLVSLTATLPARADMIDIAIQVINPDLAPARPLITCVVIKGLPIKDCAIAQGKAEFEKNEDIQRILQVYGLAKAKKYAELVSMLGVTVVCTAFEVPGSAIVCNEFGKKIAEYGAKALKLAAKIHTEVGKKVVETAQKAAKAVGCVTGIYCKNQDTKDPNKFYWKFGGTTLSMTKFNLAAIWANEYAPRIGEGINARLNDVEKLKRMVVVPPPRMTAASAPAGGGPSATFLLSPDALAFASMNATTNSWHAIGVQGVLVNIHLPVFEPFEREMNARWLALVNASAAETLEVPADRFLKDRQNWQTLAMPKISFDNFEHAHPPGWDKELLAGCRKSIEVGGTLMRRWAMGSSAAQDANTVEGRTASQWIALTKGIANLCSNKLAQDMAGRLQERDAAISWGCVPKANGLRGLDCPAQAVAMKQKFDDPTMPTGNVGIVPIELCRNAYELYGKTNPKYCSLKKREIDLPGLAPLTSAPPAAEPVIPAPALVPPVRRPPAAEPQKSTLCVFDAGPRAGQRQDYAPMAPLPVGTPCHDGRGSTGRVAPN